MKCYYHNDADGRCAGAIVCHYYNFSHAMKFIEVEYKDEINVDDIEKDERIYIVDFSFKPEVMEKILLKTNEIVWIDHHKTAMEYKYSQPIRGTRSNQYSGCELTWLWFYPDIEMPWAIKFIGDRDTWTWHYEESAYFNLGLMLKQHQPEDTIWIDLFNNRYYKSMIKYGKICKIFRDNFCNDYATSYGFETTFEAQKCFAMGLYMFGSEAFGDRIDTYDMLISFEFVGDKWIVGLYSKKVDVSVICKAYGGGGHTGAGGFTCDVLPFKKEII